jgi:virginiamycin B lyase
VTTASPDGEAITVGRRPSAIAVSPDSVWVANSADDTVFRVDRASNAVVNRVVVGDEPVAIAFGEGYVWVANAGDGTVSRIDPATDDVVTRKVGGRPEGIAVGVDAVWVTVRSR